MRPTNVIALLLLSLWSWVSAVELDLQDKSSVNDALSKIAKGLMDYYQGDKKGGTPGMMVDPYYWWEAGVAWGSMIDYWYFTGDDQYNDVVKKALLAQTGDHNDYMPANQTTTEGNDDQGFWGIAVLGAAEKNFTNPTGDDPQWLYLAQAVFNTMASRWDTKHCGGGLRWQIFTWNSGYDYKNTVSNGCLFHIAARLARYTNNKTYDEWAEKSWDWIEDVGYMEPSNSSSSYTVYDGGYIKDNCSEHDKLLWSYNYGLYLAGAAYMHAHTNDSKWTDRVNMLWKGSDVFFKDDIMYEAACQPSGKCNNDQRCFKGIFSRFLGLTAQLVPDLREDILTKLNASAQAAAKSCSGGSDGHTCGLNWFEGKWDDMFGLGEQISALEVIQNTMIEGKALPLTNDTGGTSHGSGDAGSDSRSDLMTINELTIDTKDRAGAGIITVVVITGMLGAGWWMLK